MVEPFWKPKKDFQYSKVPCCARGFGALTPEGYCEFMGGLVDTVCEGRYCFDGCFCPVRVFADSAFFLFLFASFGEVEA